MSRQGPGCWGRSQGSPSVQGRLGRERAWLPPSLPAPLGHGAQPAQGHRCPLRAAPDIHRWHGGGGAWYKQSPDGVGQSGAPVLMRWLLRGVGALPQGTMAIEVSRSLPLDMDSEGDPGEPHWNIHCTCSCDGDLSPWGLGSNRGTWYPVSIPESVGLRPCLPRGPAPCSSRDLQLTEVCEAMSQLL